MKKTAVIFIIALALCMLFSAQALFAGGQAEEGETSAPAATGVGANFAPTGIALGGSIYINYAQSFFSNSQVLTLGIYPTIGTFILQNMMLSVAPMYRFQMDFDSGDPSHMVGAGVGLDYYFYSGKSTVPSVGIDLTPYFYISYETGGITVSPHFNTYFFVTDQIAPYVGVSVSADFYDFDTDYLTLNARVGLGVVYFIPEAVGPRS